MKSDDIFVRHIFDAINIIKEHIGENGREQFLQSKIVQDAVIREREIIGEAAKNISEEYKMIHVYIPWKDVAGMRDKLINHYFGVDLEEVWKTVQDDLPEIVAALEAES